MKETRRRFIVLFCLVSLAHGVLLAGAAPLFRRSVGTALPGAQTLIVSVAPARKTAPSPRPAPRIDSRPAPIQKTSPAPSRPVVEAPPPPPPPPAPRVRPRPRKRKHAIRLRRARRHVARRIKPRPQKARPRPGPMAGGGHPPAGPAVNRAPVRMAHLGANRRPGLLRPDTRAMCLNGHIFKSHYPEWARQRGWQGRVVLKVLVTADGRVGRVETVRRSAHDILNRTAVRIARRLRFKPARRGGRPVESWVRMPVKYVIVEPD